MPKTLVIYFSKYGATKKYAEWIAGELGGDVCGIRDVNVNALKDYDAIVVGSGLYAGNIKGIDILVNNFETLKGKKMALFTCGLADYGKDENRSEISKRIEAAIPENIRQNIKIYFLRGAIDYSKLTAAHKMMMAFVKKLRVKKDGENYSEEDKAFLETYGKAVDYTDKNSIAGIVEYCREGLKGGGF